MDWIPFLEAHGINYVTRGPNTKRGEVSVKCPWCGDEDPSEHLGINLTKEAWGCYRNAEHRGRKPASLISALLGCTLAEAQRIAKQSDSADPDSLEGAIAMLTADNRPPVRAPAPKLVLPKEFKPIVPTGLRKPFWEYLRDGRGFNREDLGPIVLQYGLSCALTGRWKNRVLFPVKRADGTLAGWTGRAVGPAEQRYLTSGDQVKEHVLFEDQLMGGGTMLWVTEGPFDALKMDYYGKPKIRATCLFGTSATYAQMRILRRLADVYQDVVIMFDSGAHASAMALSSAVGKKNVGNGFMNQGKDPGDLEPEAIRKIAGFI